MATRRQKYPQNVEGAYYVDRTCIDCARCRELAPDFFAAEPTGHSAVIAQPQTASQSAACEAALTACPVNAIGRDGDAAAPPSIRKLLPDLWALGYASDYTDQAAAYLIVRPGGNVMIDVPRFDDDLLPQIQALGDLAYIFITHDDHVGELTEFQAHFGAEVIVHETEADAVELGASRAFSVSDRLFDDLEILHTPGHSAGSSCLLWRRHGGCLFTGDHVLPVGNALTPVRYEWTLDWNEQLEQARRLLDLPWNHAFPGRDVESLTRGFVARGKDRLAEALADLRNPAALV